MALKGTISDFGIADIIQLIGQQIKTGVLILGDEVDEVRVFFRAGAVVRAESPTRPKNMLLGNMLVNSELITPEDLQQALKIQARNIKRLGTVLVEMGVVKESDVAEVIRLQMTETLYPLFLWEVGTYEFEHKDVEEPPPGLQAIRAENILMEGLRVMDEWPALRSRLPAYSATFQTGKPLPEAKSTSDVEFGDLEAAFGGAEQPGGGDALLGDVERRVHALVVPKRSLQKIIHLSRCGEFDVCKSMMTLLDGGYITEVVQKVEPVAGAKGWLHGVKAWEVLGRAGLYLVLLTTALLLVRNLNLLSSSGHNMVVENKVAHRYLAANQMEMIRLALEVYRYQIGEYPPELEALVRTGIVREGDIQFPYQTPYFYAVRNGRAELLPPLY